MFRSFAPDENGYASGERDLVGGFVFIVGAEGQLVLGLLVFGDVVYGYERSARSARYFVFVLDR